MTSPNSSLGSDWDSDVDSDSFRSPSSSLSLRSATSSAWSINLTDDTSASPRPGGDSPIEYLCVTQHPNKPFCRGREELCASGSSRSSSISAGATQTASANHPKLVMHERYYYADGTVSLEVEGVLYNVHRYLMAKDSSFFVLHHETSDPIFFPDITKRDLDIFLSVFYPRNYGDFEASTIEEWSAILRLSDKWGFETVKNLAVSKIAPMASPIDMIVLGRRYSIDSSHLVDAYDDICLRPAPLTLEEGNRVGMEDVIKIMAIRQEFDLGSRTFTSAPLPTLEQLRCHFGLLDGKDKKPPTLIYMGMKWVIGTCEDQLKVEGTLDPVAGGGTEEDLKKPLVYAGYTEDAASMVPDTPTLRQAT
ncbi:hypothetical protein FIBSPDRAFT_1054391 [Athelia psychrophila]|uniref:BTB domain-containing protein n=1 Tax=Athelia psychrophila TaxID=1759441 RepID=A0A167VDW1_9AGAM|nr:hypothetical protein FIBSPDRAFT_1054391 [Fibularhizoctonia sp. CBS 109695]